MQQSKTLSLSGFFFISAIWHLIFILLFSTVFYIRSGHSTRKRGIQVVYVADSGIRTLRRLSSRSSNASVRVPRSEKKIRPAIAIEKELFAAPERKLRVESAVQEFFDKKEPGIRDAGRTDLGQPVGRKIQVKALNTDRSVRLSPNLQQRKIRWMPKKPRCPLWAEKAGIELDIKLRIVIGADGRIRKTNLLKSSGDPDLDTRVRKFVNEFFFEKKPDPGKEETGTINIFFRLQK